MGLSVTRLALRDWRNFEWNDIEFGAMTVLYGPNAVGKTNTVEALQLLTSGQSFRKPKPAQLIREEAPSARAEATLPLRIKPCMKRTPHQIAHAAQKSRERIGNITRRRTGEEDAFSSGRSRFR